MIDHLDILVHARLGPTVDANATEALLREYGELLTELVQPDANSWLAPRNRDLTFECTWRDQRSTISGAKLTARIGHGAVGITLTATANPTRTLRHLWQGSTGISPEQLSSLSPEEFFGPTLGDHERDLEGKDNLLPRVDQLKEQLGDDYGATYLPIFEAQLRAWATGTIAPRSAGFEHNGVTASRDDAECAIRVDWSHVTVRSAEAYFDRIHGGAIALIERVLAQITAGHVGSRWRRYTQSEVGGRAGRSAIVGVELTNDVRQVFYAKTASKVRIETRYQRGVRKAVRESLDPSSPTPMTDLLLAVRADAVERTQWQTFCGMCEEQPRVLIAELAELFGAIAECCRKARVRAEPVFSQLLLSGGIEQTDKAGIAPRRLIKQLATHGVIEASSLRRRRRRGAVIRYPLAPKWLEAAQRLQEVFVGGSGTTSPRTP